MFERMRTTCRFSSMPENAFLLPARAAGEQVATADMKAKEALKVFRTEQISAYRKNANELVAAGAPKELVMLNYLPEDLLNCLRKPSAQAAARMKELKDAKRQE